MGPPSCASTPSAIWLALLAALVWAVYAVLTRRIAAFGCPTVQATRRVFFYGLLFMLPALLFTDFHWGFARFANPMLLFNILYLGLGASALCFVTWNFAVRRLGAVKTSVYIYCVPIITVATSVIVLRERITPLATGGQSCWTLGGAGPLGTESRERRCAGMFKSGQKCVLVIDGALPGGGGREYGGHPRDHAGQTLPRDRRTGRGRRGRPGPHRHHRLPHPHPEGGPRAAPRPARAALARRNFPAC